MNNQKIKLIYVWTETNIIRSEYINDRLHLFNSVIRYGLFDDNKIRQWHGISKTWIEVDVPVEIENCEKSTPLGQIKNKESEPKLEVDDWCLQEDRYTDVVYVVRDIPTSISLELSKEIRKSNGDVWRKINGEWKKI